MSFPINLALIIAVALSPQKSGITEKNRYFFLKYTMIINTDHNWNDINPIEGLA